MHLLASFFSGSLGATPWLSFTEQSPLSFCLLLPKLHIGQRGLCAPLSAWRPGDLGTLRFLLQDLQPSENRTTSSSGTNLQLPLASSYASSSISKSLRSFSKTECTVFFSGHRYHGASLKTLSRTVPRREAKPICDYQTQQVTPWQFPLAGLYHLWSSLTLPASHILPTSPLML